MEAVKSRATHRERERVLILRNSLIITEAVKSRAAHRERVLILKNSLIIIK